MVYNISTTVSKVSTVHVDSSNRQHYETDDCLEKNREDY